ncbi:MAG: cysteine desulfurase [Aphanocapsa feldmannii 288cV]|nr:MAG: cysteine desulfurase [Aphanocapsa feldmannii 288cV]
MQPHTDPQPDPTPASVPASPDVTGYCDGSASAPLHAAVATAMDVAQRQCWGNPSSIHTHGSMAAEAMERARLQVAALVGVSPDWVTFTSGGTEANHLALEGLLADRPAGRLLISAVEHPAMALPARRLGQAGWKLETIPVDGEGLLDLQALEVQLRQGADLVSVIGGQSEVGTLQPLAAISDICHHHAVPFHSDAVQLAGKVPLAMGRQGPDLLSLSAHKFMGPKGVGALVADPALPLSPRLLGGSQEAGRRAGTQPVPLIVGMGVACAVSLDTASEAMERVGQLRDRLLEDCLKRPGMTLTGPRLQRLPHHISLLVGTPQGEPLDGRALVRGLNREGFSVSSGSACAAGQSGDSPVLTAMGIPSPWRRSGLRISLGPWVSETRVLQLPSTLDRVRRESGLVRATDLRASS